MKTNKLLKEIITRAFLFLIILIIAVSCRKDNGNLDPIVPIPPDDPNPPAVFVEKPLNILSDYEKTNNLNFPGNTIYKSGAGLTRGMGHGLFEGAHLIGEVVWEAYDYLHTESRFDEIDDQLIEMEGQITELTKTMNDMGNSLQISIHDLTSYIHTNDLTEQIEYVQSVMDSSTQGGLRFYSKTARLYMADTNNAVMRYQMQLLKDHTDEWANGIYYKSNTSYMPDVIDAMKHELCPLLGDSTDNALSAYATTLIDLCQGKVTDSLSAMSAYLLLESYFLTVINYQFQGAAVYVNAANFIDTTGYLASSFWETHVVGNIHAEVQVFLENVDYLAANLSEYRTQQKFEHDMQYSASGLAPDNLFYNVYARSQFLANLLNYSLGLTPSIVSGHIMVPDHYGPNGALAPDALSVNVGSKPLISTSKKQASVIPYTWWATNYVCTPDNHWRTYRLTSSDTVWATGPQTVTVAETGQDSPWTHYVPITGTVTTLYYNPANPQQHSATKTDLCTVQFGYFAANWQWGYLYLTNSPRSSGWKHINRFYFDSFNHDIWWSQINKRYTVCQTPFALTTDTRNQVYLQGPDINFTYPNNTPGSMIVSGLTSYTNYFYVVVNSLNCAVTTSSVLPPKYSSNVAPGLRAWACYNSYYGMQGNGGVDLTVNIGTNMIEKKYLDWEHYSVGDQVIRTNWHNAMGIWKSGFGQAALAKSTSYEPGVQFYYQTANLTQTTADIRLQTAYQFVYDGLYDLAK
ncbi:MAG: hypothetical protein WCM93_07110 [Bacteroidota bacterium]